MRSCLIVCLFHLVLHDEALENYMKLSKIELNKLDSKVWVAMNILCRKHVTQNTMT